MASRRRILVVDDDHECRLMLSTIVAQAGYAADSVADGNMALAMIRSRPPDLVLLDAHLPGVDGWKVCESIKGDDRTKHTPVVILTAFASDDAEKRSHDAGADEYVTKPFRRENLVDLMTQLLEIGDAARQLDLGADAMADALDGK